MPNEVRLLKKPLEPDAPYSREDALKCFDLLVPHLSKFMEDGISPQTLLSLLSSLRLQILINTVFETFASLSDDERKTMDIEKTINARLDDWAEADKAHIGDVLRTMIEEMGRVTQDSKSSPSNKPN